MCGVFGIRSPERDVSRLSYFGLFALQHRGQESAGIAVSDRGRLTVLREMGLVAHVFDEQQLQALPGEVAIGHTRYSTTGANKWSNAQPLIHHGSARTIALGHNGNLVNVEELRAELLADGIRAGLGLRHRAHRGARRPRSGAARRGGRERDDPARGRVLGHRARRRHARRLPRPARLPPAHARAARRRLGRRVRDVRARSHRRGGRARRPARRGRLGRRGRAARGAGACPRDAARSASSSTCTSRVPTRASAASRCTARGCAWASGSPRRHRPTPISSSASPTAGRRPRSGSRRRPGSRSTRRSIKNRYVARTFIQPEQGMREQGIRMKFNPLGEVEGKRIVVVDDSIVRGNTTRQLVQMLFDAGAAEVHVRISSPPGRLAVLLRDRHGRRGRARRGAPLGGGDARRTSARPRSTTSRSRACRQRRSCRRTRSAARASRASTRRASRRGPRSSASRPRAPRRRGAAGAGRRRSSCAGTRRSPRASAAPAPPSRGCP